MESFLYRMHRAIARDAFNGRYLCAIRLDGEHGTRFDAFAVEQHGTSATLTRVAPDVRSR